MANDAPGGDRDGSDRWDWTTVVLNVLVLAILLLMAFDEGTAVSLIKWT